MLTYLPFALAVITAASVVIAGGPFFRRAAWRTGLIDRPKLRGVHGEPVARSGGVTIAAALLAAVLVQMMSARALGVHGAYLHDVNHLYLLLPALLLMGLGVIDDVKPLGAVPKLAVQAACATAAWFLDFRVEFVNLAGLVEFDVALFSLPLTVVFIVAVTNAFNMIDGVDGLCAGTGFLALAGVGLFALYGGEFQLALAIPLGVAALAFLKENFGKPKAFLGDSGSMLLGFVVAALSLRAVVTPSGALSVAPLLLLLSLPVVDITVVFFRRLLQGANPLQADRGHIHHILLLLLGGHNGRVTAMLLAMAAVSAGAALLTGLQPALSGLALALPVGMYFAVYAAGGYLSWRNLRNAGPATDLAITLAEVATEQGPEEAFNGPEMVHLLGRAGITAIGLFNEGGTRVWSAGVPDPGRDTLTLPLYAAGRVRCGRLHLQGAGNAGRMAFAAHLLQPLYPAFMEILDERSTVIPDTVRVST
ncbi:MAG: undecaprenyl/decaprenyl-phosphate alpha-N-acetylglucosaminyl 1-phosphate transferase [Planctomycetes bacterium]|nr:undecaprenyl/decaprenyl-phosphate alpha-N-acetylglucosaminyl 1-phosphate transferase [Planctomycetota bacterium]MCW8136295.1 undecaprenyl/decaprenyl-phosphate alpha-N-acetylglucosaminyl 1-phosphate transferase [Planctomycetota bacterium]